MYLSRTWATCLAVSLVLHRKKHRMQNLNRTYFIGGTSMEVWLERVRNIERNVFKPYTNGNKVHISNQIEKVMHLSLVVREGIWLLVKRWLL